MSTSTKVKIAYVITERNGKSHWNRVGIGFVNRDGSINLKLDSVPVSGELQIRDYVPREDSVAPSLRSSGSNGHASTTERYVEAV
jgi:hypothetical protein